MKRMVTEIGSGAFRGSLMFFRKPPIADFSVDRCRKGWYNKEKRNHIWEYEPLPPSASRCPAAPPKGDARDGAKIQRNKCLPQG